MFKNWSWPKLDFKKKVALGTVATLALLPFAIDIFIYKRRIFTRANDPVTISGKLITGCTQALEDDMYAFLLKCYKKYGPVFTLRTTDGKYQTYILDGELIKTIIQTDKHNLDRVEMLKKSKERFGMHEIVTHEIHDAVLHLSKSTRNGLSTNRSLHALHDSLKKSHVDNLPGVINSDYLNKKINLFDFVTMALQVTEFFVLFGKQFSYDKENYKNILEYDKLVGYRYNGRNIQFEMNEVKKALVKSFAETETKDVSPVMNEYYHLVEKLGVSKTEHGRMKLQILFGAQANTKFGTFWLLYRCYINKKTLKKLRDEMFRVLNIKNRNDKNEFTNKFLNIDMQMLVNNKFELLDSMVYEVFRYYGQSNVYRKVINSDIKIKHRNKLYKIRKNDWLVLYPKFINLDNKTFPDSNRFINTRFIKNYKENRQNYTKTPRHRKIVNKKSSIFTFGIAFGTCPAKKFSIILHKLFAIYTMFHYDIEFVNSNQKIPKIPSSVSAIAPPIDGDIPVIITPRKLD